MNEPLLLISAYFPYNHCTELGGRNQHLCEAKYLSSLQSLVKMQTPFEIWVDSRHFNDDLYKIRIQTDYSHISYKPLSLYESRLYSTIRRLKHKKGIRSYRENRSYDFCINKLLMIQSTLADSANERFEYCWWIDAGLSYECLFPHRYFPLIADKTHPRCWAECDLFTPTLAKNLCRQSDDKINAFMISRPEHGIDRNDFPRYYELGKTIIGGLFGGRRSVVTAFINDLVAYMERCLEQEKLYLEEVYITNFYMNHPERFNLFEFDTWYSRDQTFALDEEGNPPPGRAFYHYIERFAERELTDFPKE